MCVNVTLRDLRVWGWDKSPGQVGVPGLVNKANCSREEAGVQLPLEVLGDDGVQLPLEVLGDGGVQLPLEVLGDDGAQEADGLNTVNWGGPQGDAVGWGWVLPEIDNHLHCFQRVELQVVLSTPGHQMVYLPPVGSRQTHHHQR